jgi:hypothetical protein
MEQFRTKLISGLMKCLGVTFLILGIYQYLSFSSTELGFNFLKESCGYFGYFEKFICQYASALNYFLVCVLVVIGYTLLVYKKRNVSEQNSNG